MRSGRGRVYVIAQARMGSTRLPGKVLLPLAGRPVAEWVMERASRARVDGAVLAIPEGSEDNPLEEFASRNGYRVYRGDAADVQARYLAAASSVHAETIVRLTCDNPLVDGVLIDAVVENHRRAAADYSSFGLSGPYPLGFAVEAFSLEALRKARDLSTEPHDREHVTPALYNSPDRFRLNPVTPPPAFRRNDLRLTLDAPEDYEAIRRLVALAGPEDPMEVGAQRYLELLLDHPEVRALNVHVRQKGLGD